MSGALGLTLGPVIASFLSGTFEYVGTLLIFAALILVVGSVAVWQLPSKLDQTACASLEPTTASEVTREKPEFFDVPYSSFFMNRRALMAVQEKMPWQLFVVRVVSPFRLLMNSTIMKLLHRMDCLPK